MRPLEESVKEEKSQADKIFEELGFNMDSQIKNSYYNIIEAYKHQLEIDFIDKDIIISKTDYDLIGDIHSDTVYLNAEIIKAINRKCEELGWL